MDILTTHYLYFHFRADNDQLFYVGIGTIQNRGNRYARAYQTKGRSSLWKNVSNKYGYRVEVVQEYGSRAEAIADEILTIKKYGKISEGSGTLVNLTDGGEGLEGFKHSEETKRLLRVKAIAQFSSVEAREQMSKCRVGIKASEETKRKLSAARKGKKRSPEAIEKSAASRRGIKHSEETKQLLSAKSKAYFSQPGVREEMARIKTGVKASEETKKKMSDAHKGRKKSPEAARKSGLARRGRKASEESREKMSAAQKKRFETEIPWNLGKSASAETRQKLSEALKGRTPTFLGKKHSEESKRKMSEASKGQAGYWKGKPMSEETKQKLSLAKKGSPGHWTGKERPALFKKVINTETGVIYDSQKEAALREGINRNTLTAKLLGNKRNNTPLLYLTDYEKQKDTPQSVSFQFHQ